MTAPGASSQAKQMTPSQIISAAKKKDAKGLAKRYSKLKSSKAMVDVVNATITKKQRAKHLQLLAAMSTSSQVSKLVAKTKGKHFKVTISTSAQATVKLLKGKGSPSS